MRFSTSMGHRQVIGLKTVRGIQAGRKSGLGDAPRDLCPDGERMCPGGTVLVSGEVIAAEVEEVADLRVGGKEALQMLG